MAISLILHKWDGSKFLKIDDMYHRHTGYLLMFDGHPATLHLTIDEADDFLFELETEYGMNVTGTRIVEIKMPTIAEQFLLEEAEENIKEVFLKYDPNRARENEE